MPEGPPPGFSLNNIEIDEGSIAFDDGRRAASTASSTSSSACRSSRRCRTRSTSASPRDSKAPSTDRISLLGGTTAPVRGAARGGDRHRPRCAAAQVDYVAYLPTKPRIDLADGRLTTRLKVVFVDGKPDERKLEVRGDARVDGLAARAPRRLVACRGRPDRGHARPDRRLRSRHAHRIGCLRRAGGRPQAPARRHAGALAAPVRKRGPRGSRPNDAVPPRRARRPTSRGR